MGFKKMFNRLSRMTARFGFATSAKLSKNQSEQMSENEKCDRYDFFELNPTVLKRDSNFLTSNNDLTYIFLNHYHQWYKLTIHFGMFFHF